MGKELLDTLCAHLGTGCLSGEQVDRMARLDAMCPDECRPAAMRLFRVTTLTEAEHDRLLAGQAVELNPRSHDCWSKDDVRIRFILRHRAWRDPERTVSVILSQEFGAGDLAVDVEAVARHLGMDRPGSGFGPSWHVYAGAEQEVLVRNPDGRVIIRPEDVAFSWRGEERNEVWAPVVGEMFDDEEDKPCRVDAVLGFIDGGSFRVQSGDRVMTMAPYDGWWYVTETEAYRPEEMSP